MTPRAWPPSNLQDTEKTMVFMNQGMWSTDSKTKTVRVSGMLLFFQSPSQRSRTVEMATKRKISPEMTYYSSSAFWKENCRSAGWELSLSHFNGKTAWEFGVHAAQLYPCSILECTWKQNIITHMQNYLLAIQGAANHIKRTVITHTVDMLSVKGHVLHPTAQQL